MRKLLFLSLVLSANSAWANTATVTWSAPTKYTDGSALTVAHYNVYKGASPQALTKLTQVGAVLTYADTAATPGQYYTVTALDAAGVESAKPTPVCYQCQPSNPSSLKVQ